MQRALQGSRYAAWIGSRPLPTLQPALHAHRKWLEAADEDCHEAVDGEDVESVPTPHACTHSSTLFTFTFTCAARHGQTVTDVQLRPSPLARVALRAHADASPVFRPRFPASAHSCSLPIGVHMTTLRCVFHLSNTNMAPFA